MSDSPSAPVTGSASAIGLATVGCLIIGNQLIRVYLLFRMRIVFVLAFLTAAAWGIFGVATSP